MIFNKLIRAISRTSPYKEIGISWITEKTIKHTKSNGLKHINLKGYKFFYNTRNELVQCLIEIFAEESYKFYSIKEEPVIFDCGSHIGSSILYFKMLYPKCKIIAYEPDNTNYQVLTKNIKTWGFDNISVFQNPVWNSDEEITFSAEGSMDGKISNNNLKTNNNIKLKAIRLSDQIKTEIDFLKIDIEGSEYEVIVDCKEKLHFVNNIFIEYHATFSENYKLIEILSILQETGFNYYIKESNNLYPKPFERKKRNRSPFDLQLNIFAFRDSK